MNSGQWLGKIDSSSSERYWRDRLRGVGAATAIDLPRRGSERRGGYHEHLSGFSREMTLVLTEFAISKGLMINTLVEAAWAILLARYSREEDVVFGCVRRCGASGETGGGDALPIRVRVTREMRLTELLESLREQEAALGEYGQAPLSDMERWCGVAPLFRSIVVFEDAPGEGMGYPLALYCDGGAELSLKIAADATFEPEAVARMAGHLGTMLEAMARHGERDIGSLPMLTGGELEELGRWNATGRAFSDSLCVHQLVESHAKETPGRTAVTFERDSLTYGELNARANKLGRHLHARGVGTGDLVGLCVERSCEMIVAMLGILKAGGAYVPLDPAYPRERIAQMIENSGAALIVTQEGVAGDLPAGNKPMLLLDGDRAAIERECGEDLAHAISSDGVAYVIYTSGSTGKPKGIAIEHRAVVNFLESMRREPGLSAEDTLLAVTTICFDIAGLEIFLPLSTGAQVLLASREAATDATRLAQLLEHATVMQATPATWRMLDRSGWQGNSKLNILCGGEALAPELARSLLGRCGELWNMYGPTETTIWSTCHRIESAEGLIPVGRPIANTTVYVLGMDRTRQAVDVAGELYIGGAGVARGYHNLPELTREKFVRDPFSSDPAARMYATGDLARFAPDGTIEVLGRIDRQIKVRGFRIEAGEIETRLCEYPAVRQAAVTDRADASGERILVAYSVCDAGEIPAGALRVFLAERLPGHMIPSAFVALEGLPLTPNGKVDYRALPEPEPARTTPAANAVPPRGATEERLAAIWSEVLQRKIVDVHDNFFDLGGTSLKLAEVHSGLVRALRRQVSVTTLFQYPTIASLAAYLERDGPAGAAFPPSLLAAAAERAQAGRGFGAKAFPAKGSAGRGMGPSPDGVAIIGMAGVFPGARNVGEFWENLVAGKDSVTHFSDEELGAAGYDGKALRALPGYVAARGIVEQPEWFDRRFFGISPKEAEVIDPQHRVFLELAWEALEDAACDPSRFGGLIGVFAGTGDNSYYPYFVREQRELTGAVGPTNTMVGNEKDFLATRVAYKLNLRGPALSIQTACSTSLVTVCVACQNLLTYQCDVALAGGVALMFPHVRGYFFQDGSMTSPDGWCRPFDARAIGRVFSNGAGVVALKRLREAVADGDRIYAVIKGQALNNDGARKVSFTAPSVDAHSEVVALAQAIAHTPPETISYIEAHGTATALGDPIEIAGLTQVFRAATQARQFCAVGSVKGNIGHCDAAAGVAGLIKTALALHHGKIPASLKCERVNPALRIEESPFFINTALREWPRDASGRAPRRAGVSSLGIGGTNAHVVLEEAPVGEWGEGGAGAQVLVLSGKTAAALERRALDLAGRLEAEGDCRLADVAWTLQMGRQVFQHRRVVVARDREGAIFGLRGGAKLMRVEDRLDTPVAFLFPGQGSQYAGMGAGLYESEKVFRGIVDQCAEILREEIGCDLREVIFAKGPEAEARLRETRFTQPAIFAMGCALGSLWLARGVRPAAMVGHSVGEFVAATLAGVFSMQEAARLVATRARLVQELPQGAMVAARLGEAEARELLIDAGMDIAAVNSPRLSVFAGPFEAIAALEETLRERNIPARRLSTSHAFHSPMIEAALPAFARAAGGVSLQAPALPMVSSVTGNWMTEAQATDPQYWIGHMRATVRFSEAVGRLFDIQGIALLEAGPGQTLGQLARQCPRKTGKPEIAHSIEEGVDEEESLAWALGRLWLAGVPVDWAAVHGGAARRRVSLPGYPFERQRYFADLPPGTPMPLVTAASDGEAPIDDAAAAVEPSVREQTTLAEASMAAEFEPAAGGEAIAKLKELLNDLSGLDLAAVSPATTLLELGFDSLFLSQIARAISRKFGVKIAVRQLVRELGPLEALAAHLDRERPSIVEAPKASPAPIPEAATASAASERIPLTESQREVWLLCQQSAVASTACNETWTLHLDGEMDVPALEAAVREIVERHDALRSTFDPSGETLSVAARLGLDVPFTDLSILAEEEREERLAAMRSAEGAFVFDLARGPLLRVRIVRIEGRRHALIFNAHHIVCDGWSCDIFLNELAAIYSASREGRTHELPTAMQMREYQRWEEEIRGTPQFAAETKFWSEKFRTPPPLLELPGDRPHPARRSYRGASEVIGMPQGLPQALVKLGARHGATLFTVLLAAYETFLYRLTGETDLSIGFPYAGQNDTPGGAHLVGHCVNMLSMRTRLEGSQTFEGLLGVLQTEVLEALEHTRVTFGWLLQNLELTRLPGRVPLIPATFNVYPPLSHLHFSGLAHRLDPNPCSAFQFDFTINCDQTPDPFRLICKYNADLFEPETIRRWMEHFRILLEAAVADPAQPLDQLALLDEAGRRRMLLEWNETGREFPAGALLHRMFEAQAGRTPDAVAVTFGEEEMSYAELNRRANQLARRLQELGVGRDVLAGICMERSIEMVVAMFAVLKAGGAYVPLDPSYPAERLGYMIEDGRMAVILTRGGCAGICRAAAKDPRDPRDVKDSEASPWNPVRIVIFEEEDCGGEDAGNLPEAMPAESLAYVLYTSGSTGKPKGVMIPHSAICNHMLWMQEEFPLDERDRVLQKTSISFDASVWEFFAPLFAGARLVMAEPGGHRDSRYLAEAVGRHGITTLQLVPSMLRMLVEEPGLAACAGSLRRLFCGGEALTPELCDKFFARMGNCELINLYGPTECAIDATFHRCAPGAKVVPIGQPVANTRLYILDATGQPAPIGVTGELVIGGAQLARGYWAKPDLTAAAFVSLDGERVYKTGDLARRLPGGEVEFLGRADGQVKLRGHRLELGEIEKALERLPGVAEAAVVLREDAPGEKRLAAYLVRERNGADAAGENGRASEATVLTELKRTLPDYMMPSAFVFLDAFPRTPNGKLDRRALPAPDYAAPREGALDFVAPSTKLEERVAEIWREVLGVARIGVNDNFLALGGESLLALRIVNRLREMLGEDISLGIIFEAPTVALLAGALCGNWPGAVERFLKGGEGSGLPAGNGHGGRERPGRSPIPRLSRVLRQAPGGVLGAAREA